MAEQAMIRKKMRFGEVIQGVHLGEGVHVVPLEGFQGKCLAAYVHPKHLWHPKQNKCRRCGIPRPKPS